MEVRDTYDAKRAMTISLGLCISDVQRFFIAAWARASLFDSSIISAKMTIGDETNHTNC
jgi:hypothetical protein